MNIEHITVAFVGVDERSKLAYQSFFESIEKVKYKIVNDFREAQLCLVDKDSHKVNKQYNEIINHYPEKYILSISIVKQICAHRRELYLQKPIKREVMQAIMAKLGKLIPLEPDDVSVSSAIARNRKVVKKLSNKRNLVQKNKHDRINAESSNIGRTEERGKSQVKDESNNTVGIKKIRKAATVNAGKFLKIKYEEYYVGGQADADISDPEQLRKIHYSPGLLLQEIIETACEKSRQNERIIQLSILSHNFYFDYSAQKVYTNASTAVIRPLCVIHHEDDVLYSVKHLRFKNEIYATLVQNRKKFIKKSLERQIWNMDSFKWIIALWCSRGRVPEGVDVTQPVYLRQWPNLTRLELIPHAVQIASLIYKHPRSLIDTAKQLDIEQRYVFAFFSACKSIGLSDVSRRDVDKLFIQEKPAPNKNKSILGKLLGQLVRFPSKSSVEEVAK